MYNRYIPTPDGSYKKQSMPDCTPPCLRTAWTEEAAGPSPKTAGTPDCALRREKHR